MIKLSNNSEGKNIFRNIKKYFFGVVSGTLMLLLLICLCALILTHSDIPDSFVTVFAIVCLCLAAFTAGLVSTLMIRSKGLTNGLITGICFFALQLICGLIMPDSGMFSYMTLVYLLIDVVMASVGGIVCVNFRR